MDKSEQIRRAENLAAMHKSDDVLVLPNAWDVVSARVLMDAGFEAIATTSGGCAFSLVGCQ